MTIAKDIEPRRVKHLGVCDECPNDTTCPPCHKKRYHPDGTESWLADEVIDDGRELPYMGPLKPDDQAILEQRWANNTQQMRENGWPPPASIHPPGSIIIAAGEFLRHGAFVNSLLQTKHPAGTSILIKQSVAVVENLNDCIRKMTGDWIWIQADDQSWKPTALISLLDRGVDVVVPLILKRSPPYHPVAFKHYDPEQGFFPFALTELPTTGLVELAAAGSGGMLIRKHVLDAVGGKAGPWFTYGSGETLNEDLRFCLRVIEAGFKIHLDVEVQMGHRASYTVEPTLTGDHWDVGLNFGQATNGNTNSIIIDAATINGATTEEE